MPAGHAKCCVKPISSKTTCRINVDFTDRYLVSVRDKDFHRRLALAILPVSNGFGPQQQCYCSLPGPWPLGCWAG